MTAPARTNVVRTVEQPAPAMVERAKSRELEPFTTDQARALIQPLLKPGDSFDRVLSETWLAMQRQPELVECTADSMLNSVARIVSWGLVIGETAHLVPFNVKVKEPGKPDRWEKRAQAIRGYQGTIQLVVNSGAARYVDAKCVYENELPTFEYEEGTHPLIRHRPILDPSKRGKLVGAYGVAKINAFDIKIAYMSVEEIDAIRMKHSKSWKEEWVDGQKVPIPLDRIPWYARKTMVLQVTKMLPKAAKTSEVVAQLERDLAGEMELEAIAATEPKQIPTPEQNTIPASLTSPAEPTAAAPASTADDYSDFEDGADEDEMTTERALTMPLPGAKTAWNGKGGTPLGALDAKMIPAIRKWINGKIEESEARNEEAPPVHYELRKACDVIIAMRKAEAEKDQTTMNLGAPAPAAATESTDTPKDPTALAPGKMQDALDLPTKSVQTMPMLASRAVALLKEKKFTDDERRQYKAQYDKADTIEAMAAVVKELEVFLGIEF